MDSSCRPFGTAAGWCADTVPPCQYPEGSAERVYTLEEWLVVECAVQVALSETPPSTEDTAWIAEYYWEAMQGSNPPTAEAQQALTEGRTGQGWVYVLAARWDDVRTWGKDEGVPLNRLRWIHREEDLRGVASPVVFLLETSLDGAGWRGYERWDELAMALRRVDALCVDAQGHRLCSPHREEPA